MTDLDDFLRGYIECALWSSTDQADDQGGAPLDDIYEPADLDHEALDSMRHDCADFMEGCGADLEAYCEQMGTWHGGADAKYNAMECAGHDFWLTRNGHGAGFWDRGLGELGERLTAMAKPYGESCLYIADDNTLCVA